MKVALLILIFSQIGFLVDGISRVRFYRGIIPMNRVAKISVPIQVEKWDDGEVPWEFIEPKKNGTKGNETDTLRFRDPVFPPTPKNKNLIALCV